MGTSRALDLLWSSRRIDAEEAFRMGFVDRVVPADQLIERDQPLPHRAGRQRWRPGRSR